jgi:hypothetical protein
MLINGVAQIAETALPFPQLALLHLVTCVQLRLKQFSEIAVALRLPVSLVCPLQLFSEIH